MTWFNDQKYLLVLPKTLNRASQDRLWIVVTYIKKIHLGFFKWNYFPEYVHHMCVCNYKEKQKEKLKNISTFWCALIYWVSTIY